MEAAIKTHSAEIRKHFLRDLDHRYSDIDVTTVPHNFVVQDVFVLIFHNADRNTQFYRVTCLAFRNPPRVRLKDGEYFFVLWDRLAFGKTLVDLVDLSHSMHDEVLDLMDLLGSDLHCCQFHKDCFDAADKFSAGFKIGLDMLWTGASGLPNLVEFYP